MTLSVSICHRIRDAAGAQRSANRDFLLPGNRASEQKISHVGAGNHQYKPHRPQQHKQSRANITHHLVQAGAQYRTSSRRSVDKSADNRGAIAP